MGGCGVVGGQAQQQSVREYGKETGGRQRGHAQPKLEELEASLLRSSLCWWCFGWPGR